MKHSKRKMVFGATVLGIMLALASVASACIVQRASSP